jgi:hypothetical protein
MINKDFSFVGKHVSVTSSTGIAATHYGDLGACTLHKWGGLHDGRYQNSDSKQKCPKSPCNSFATGGNWRKSPQSIT